MDKDILIQAILDYARTQTGPPESQVVKKWVSQWMADYQQRVEGDRDHIYGAEIPKEDLKPYFIDNDSELDFEMALKTGLFRARMLKKAESQPLPKRFRAQVDTNRPGAFIFDTVSQREVRIGLYAYQDFRKLLNTLFPD